MSTHQRTIEYPFVASNTQLASGTQLVYSSVTLSIPETTNLVFKSVYAEVVGVIVAPLVVWSACSVNLQLGSATSQTNAITGANDGQKLFPATVLTDFTSYFTTNWSGSSMSCTVKVTWTGPATNNNYVKLYITYEADDANTTRVKTVKIPFEGSAGALTATLTQLGSTEIPNLSTFLPEASVSVQQVWFEITGSLLMVDNSSNWSVSLDLALDSESAYVTGAQVNDDTTGSPTGQMGFSKYLWVRNDMTTTATHTFKAAMSAITHAYIQWLQVVLHVTYTYNHSSTTTVINSIQLPFEATDYPFIPVTSSSIVNATAISEFFVEEPATITLVQSGIVGQLIYGYDGIVNSPIIKVGTQTAKTYAITGTENSGGTDGTFPIGQRVDSAAAQGQGLTLARGSNSVQLTMTCSGSPNSTIVDYYLYLYLNYTSSIAGAGDGIHNCTRKYLMAPTTSAGTSGLISLGSFAPSNPYAAWWVNAISLEVLQANASAPCGMVGINSGERIGEGYAAIGTRTIASTGNGTWTAPRSFWSPKNWFRWSGDPNLSLFRLNPFTVRGWFAFIPYTGDAWSVTLTYTTHAFSFTAAGAITGYSGGGSGIVVNVFRDDKQEILATGTTISGGTFSITVPDNTLNLYAEARQDGTHLGRSNIGTGV